MSAPDLVIDVEGVTKCFDGHPVVNGISMQVRRGEIHGFLGPNGSGKTTFIRMLCGLLQPDGGRGTCLGHDLLTGSDDIKREVGYMTQRFSFYEDLTISENLDFVARVYGVPDRQVTVDASLDRLGLRDRRNQLAGTLSGGWKQRLALAACLLHKPRLLLLDEPTAGVDPKARRDFWDEIHRLAAEGLTVLITTHYMDEAERCHRLAYIAYGNILARGTSDEVVAAARLTTWAVSGPNLSKLASQLRNLPGIEQVVAFGNILHASGHDAARIEASLTPFRADSTLRWQRAESSLEDVFISLMERAEERAP